MLPSCAFSTMEFRMRHDDVSPSLNAKTARQQAAVHECSSAMRFSLKPEKILRPTWSAVLSVPCGNSMTTPIEAGCVTRPTNARATLSCYDNTPHHVADRIDYSRQHLQYRAHQERKKFCYPSQCDLTAETIPDNKARNNYCESIRKDIRKTNTIQTRRCPCA